jgi:hypothetical protein
LHIASNNLALAKNRDLVANDSLTVEPRSLSQNRFYFMGVLNTFSRNWRLLAHGLRSQCSPLAAGFKELNSPRLCWIVLTQIWAIRIWELAYCRQTFRQASIREKTTSQNADQLHRFMWICSDACIRILSRYSLFLRRINSLKSRKNSAVPWMICSDGEKVGCSKARKSPAEFACVLRRQHLVDSVSNEQVSISRSWPRLPAMSALREDFPCFQIQTYSTRQWQVL